MKKNHFRYIEKGSLLKFKEAYKDEKSLCLLVKKWQKKKKEQMPLLVFSDGEMCDIFSDEILEIL